MLPDHRGRNMGFLAFTWRQLVLLTVLSFLSLSIVGLVVLLHKSMHISVSDVQKSHGFRGGSRGIKYTRLILGDAAGEGLAGRVQCTGLYSASSNTSTGGNEESCSLSKAKSILFITFFMPLNDAPDKGSRTNAFKLRNSTIIKLDLPYAILSVYFKSIQMSNSGCLMSILTGRNANILTRRLPEGVDIVRIPQNFTRSNLMLQRLESYAYFLGELIEINLQSDTHVDNLEHIVFMDSDIIVVGDLKCLFDVYRDFDIALTFRNNKDQPINSGFIAVRGEVASLSRARAFLLEVVNVYKERFVKAARMLGDQLSLAHIIQEHSKKINLRFRKPSIFMSQISQSQVLFLPSQIYNWTPSEGAGQFHGMPENVKVIHFKGSRKRLMLEAWNEFIQSGSLVDMQCLILKSGRTKYDF